MPSVEPYSSTTTAMCTFVRLKLFQQVVDLLVFGHEIGFSQQLLPAEFVAVVDVGQQILDVEDSLDIVQILVADRNAREARSDDAFLDAQVVVADSDGDDIHAGDA